MTDEEAERAPELLQAIADGPRVGEICGVHFDFRHTSLPTSEGWHAPGAGRPFGIAFPWDRFGQSADDAETLVTCGCAGWPTTHVYAGDAINVLSVMSHCGDFRDGIDISPDNARYFLDLVIIRQDNARIPLKIATSYVHRLAVGPWSPSFENSHDDGYSEYMESFSITWDKIAEKAQARLHAFGPGWKLAITRALDFASNLSDPDCLGDAVAQQELIDLVCLVAYGLGKAEAESALANPASRALRADAKRTRSLDNAIKARRRMGDPVRAAALEVMRRKPHLSLNACANEVAGHRDQASVRRMLDPFFPKGDDGKRRFSAPGGM